MKNKNMLLWGLTLAFSILMSIPFLVPHTGLVALFALVPLLCMERIASMTGTKHIWVFHYTAFVLWNAFTTFWVCNATVGGGLFAIFANAAQMSVIFGLFRLSKKKFSGILPYVFLATMWIAWEKAYFSAEISWPWLVLGNAFARSIGSIQWYEWTGVLGGSLWVWLTNLTIFGMMVMFSDGTWLRINSKARFASFFALGFLFIVPPVASSILWFSYKEESKPLEVAIFQPNIDPYNKFENLSQRQQNAILEKQIRQVLSPRDSLAAPILLIAPETFTNDVTVGDWESSPTLVKFHEVLKDYPGANLLLGASSWSYIQSKTKPSHTARNLGEGLWIESHNSALMIDGTPRTEIFHKSKLVVGVEKTPYPSLFCKLDDYLGGVMGRCVGQDRITALNCISEGKKIPIGSAICYESIYGDYCRGYVQAGAQALAVITNDSWWGDTPGYRQHLSYSSLRAIETRRSIARCANTGISALIDQRGEIHQPTPWWEPAILQGKINLNDKVTFFVAYGDIIGRICAFVFVLLAFALAARFCRRD